MPVRPSRRQLLSAVPALAAQARAQPPQAGARPNIVLIISDQFRWDCIGAMGLNPMNLTPNLDQMARAACSSAGDLQSAGVRPGARQHLHRPVSQQARRLAECLRPRENATTLASVMRQAGYSTNYIGKWHLARPAGRTPPKRAAPCPSPNRGGFVDLWEAANALELTSHAYEGDLFDNDGKPIHFAGPLSRRLHDRPRAALPPLRPQVAVPADALLSRSPPPERYRTPSIRRRNSRGATPIRLSRRTCARCPDPGPASWPTTSPASPRWTRSSARFARRWWKPASTRTPS